MKMRPKRKKFSLHTASNLINITLHSIGSHSNNRCLLVQAIASTDGLCSLKEF